MKRSEIFPELEEIRGDSREVIAAYYAGRLLELEKELNELTLEQPRRILRICRKIKLFKKRMRNYNG